MSQQSFSRTAGIVFSLVALAHILRVVFHSDWIVEGIAIPFWVSWIAILIAAFLAYEGFRLGWKPSSRA